MEMKRKIFILLFLVILVTASFLFKQAFKPHLVPGSSYQMSGQIVKRENNKITLVGKIRIIDSVDRPGNYIEQERTITFTVTPETILKKTIYLTPKNAKPGEVYETQEIKQEGALFDLNPFISVYVQSYDNLFETDTAAAFNIFYELTQR